MNENLIIDSQNDKKTIEFQEEKENTIIIENTNNTITINEDKDNKNIVIENEKELELKLEKNDIVYFKNDDYNPLRNKPAINNVTLQYNKSLDDLGIQEKGDYANSRITNTELEYIFNDW